MGVTAIKRIDNLSQMPVQVVNRENPRQHGWIDPHTYEDCNVWIPWCTAQHDFPNRSLVVQVGQLGRTPQADVRTYAIWQAQQTDGDMVRMTTPPQFFPIGHQIPGYPFVDGDRRLVITPRHNARGEEAGPPLLSLIAGFPATSMPANQNVSSLG
jgi:hypothetical protein